MQSPADNGFDSVVVCGKDSINKVPQYQQTLSDVVAVDNYTEEARLLFCNGAPGKRLIVADTGMHASSTTCSYIPKYSCFSCTHLAKGEQSVCYLEVRSIRMTISNKHV